MNNILKLKAVLILAGRYKIITYVSLPRVSFANPLKTASFVGVWPVMCKWKKKSAKTKPKYYD